VCFDFSGKFQFDLYQYDVTHYRKHELKFMDFMKSGSPYKQRNMKNTDFIKI
jgi:hypothetical protein